MNSIAIWYEENAGTIDNVVPNLDIHINHWKLKIRMNFFIKSLRAFSTKTLGRFFPKLSFQDSDYFMDVGLMVTKGSSVRNICLYIPHVLSDKNKAIEDLGNKLRFIRMLTAVFNEPLTLNSTNAKHFEVQKNGIAFFNVFELSVENDLEIANVYNGTIIKFQHRQVGALSTYYRFRLKGGFVNNLSLTYTPSNFLFESAYSKIEVIDFRINDTRNLDVSLIEHMAKNKKFNLSLIHYFVMRNLKDDYIISNQKINSVRPLEPHTWSSYINEDEYKYEGSFAYHLKTKVTPNDVENNRFIDDFTAVFKLQYEDSKLWLYIIGFFAIALLIELGGNTTYDYVSEKYFRKSDQPTQVSSSRQQPDNKSKAQVNNTLSKPHSIQIDSQAGQKNYSGRQ